MEMGGNFCQILELGGTTIKGRRVQNINTVNLRFSSPRGAYLFLSFWTWANSRGGLYKEAYRIIWNMPQTIQFQNSLAFIT